MVELRAEGLVVLYKKLKLFLLILLQLHQLAPPQMLAG